MQNIGDRLAEARKRLGIALREASEATKIRTDYLQAMENGTFDFSLPEVYKRGFLKIYARYLKLDADKFGSDFAALYSGGAATERENLGRVEAPVAPKGGARNRDPEEDYDSSRAQNQAAMFRLAAFLGVAFVIILLLIFGFNYLLNKNSGPDESAKLANATTSANTSEVSSNPTPTPAPPSTPVYPSNKFVFNASSNINNLTVWQDSDKSQVYNGPLNKGKALQLTVKGHAIIAVSQMQFLTISYNDGPNQGIGDPTDPTHKKRLSGPNPGFPWP